MPRQHTYTLRFYVFMPTATNRHGNQNRTPTTTTTTTTREQRQHHQHQQQQPPQHTTREQRQHHQQQQHQHQQTPQSHRTAPAEKIPRKKCLTSGSRREGASPGPWHSTVSRESSKMAGSSIAAKPEKRRYGQTKNTADAYIRSTCGSQSVSIMQNTHTRQAEASVSFCQAVKRCCTWGFHLTMEGVGRAFIIQ